ncbi:thiol reductant ABC exporter subunit CydC [Pedococcus bigeumensis]|uniref:Thiol reductant ABC exporter subunit CydC n=1 Tax=Pedococcus bigeumensis TaxID=433644 RepID=A0A502CXG5_9MICO|nr:thiol reductant ABC exporter subunit CydC [Pedococcus bigeumensis]TPG17957.1 thiol reductant ABC exporter subunit CydC [Pedococcus bigeumensis]
MNLPSARVLTAGGLGATALGSGVALTATSGWLVVRASEQPVILTLLTAIVAVRTFGMARPVFRYWERLRSHDAALDELATARTRLYAALVPLTPGRLARRGRAAMLTGVVDDLTERVEAQVRVTVPILTTALTGAATAVLCAVVEPAAGAAVAALLVVAGATTTIAWRVESRGMADLTAARGDVTRTTELVASQALDLQAVGAQSVAINLVRTAQRRADALIRRQSWGRAATAATIPFATALATVVCAAVAVGSDHTAPVAALLVLAPFSLAEVFGALPEAARALARAQEAGVRLTQLLDERPAVAASPATSTSSAPDDPARAGTPHLRLSGVCASWDGIGNALDERDLEVEPGQVVAVTGPSGCGKSTMLAVLARQLDHNAGSYTVDGVEATDLDLESVRSLFAVVDDEPHVFATSVRENLRLASAEADDSEVSEALHAAGLGDWVRSLPDGLDTKLGTGARGLSGGERARLSIARALLSRRPVILLDEPVAHLDHPTAVAVLRDLVRSRAGRSVVVVSHRPEGLEGAQQTLPWDDATMELAHG